MALKRIFMLVSRGMTDATAVCIYPWERPLVQEIHGGEARIVSIDQLCNREGVAKVEDVRKVVRLPTRINQKNEEMVPDTPLTPRQQYELMTHVKSEDNPMHDPASEWNRLLEKYGAHPEIKMSVVEKVYGKLAIFRNAMRDFAAGRTPDFLDDDDENSSLVEDESGDAGAETSFAEMSAKQLKALCDDKGIKFKGNASKADLEALLMEQAA